MTRVRSLAELVLDRAAHRGDRVAFRFLESGEVDGATLELTFRELDARARSIAAVLQARGLTGERALLVFPAGLDFVAAFFGCIYGGVVAVPAYPPDPSRLARTLPPLRAIASDAGVAAVLSNDWICQAREAFESDAPELAKLPWLAVDTLPREGAGWRMPEPHPDGIAYLQYTSGSTGLPKGVIVRHSNALANLAVETELCAFDEESRVIGWVPLYHDLGLNQLLAAVHNGFECTLMAPEAFLERPVRWLEAISRFRGTHNACPNFGYELCARKATDEMKAGLDLRSWIVAGNGGESVRAETLARFAAAFATCGFKTDAFWPSYGMAESVLFVASGKRRSGPPSELHVERAGLQRGEVRVVDDDAQESAQTIVSCGHPGAGHRVVIADPEHLAALPDDRIGEIWVTGPSVCSGYWQKVTESQQTFATQLESSTHETFLRTGDLGFLHEGELYIAGRLKDLIIVRGRNHHPQDIERTVEASHARIRPGCSAAFTVEGTTSEELVIVAEVRKDSGEDLAALWDEVRRSVSERHGLAVRTIVLLPPGGLLKTTSGKIQRRAIRSALLAGTLSLLARSDLAPGATQEPGRVASMEEAIRHDLARVLGIDPATIDLERGFVHLGLDSVAGAELGTSLAARFNIALSATALFNFPTVAALARHLDELRGAAPTRGVESVAKEEPVERISDADAAEMIRRRFEAL